MRVLKVAAQAFEAADFLNIFLRFWGFCGTFSYQKDSYKNMCRANRGTKSSLRGVFQF